MPALTKSWRLTGLVACAAACGGDDLPPSPVPPPPPAEPVPAVAIVSGNNQTGTFGQFLPAPLVVRVTNRAGQALSNVKVRWTIASGDGEFAVSPYTYATPEGVASITVRPMWPSPLMVTATADALGEPPAMFTETASGQPVVRMWFGPLFDCIDDYEWWGFNGQAKLIPLGARVEWSLACGGHLRSIAAPPGGTPFDMEGLRFSVVLDAVGEWRVEEVATDKTTTLRVR